MTKLVLFGSPTCAPCFALKGKLDSEGIKYEYVDATANPELASEHLIMSTPTALFVNGEDIVKVIGKGNIEEKLEDYREELK